MASFSKHSFCTAWGPSRAGGSSVEGALWLRERQGGDAWPGYFTPGQEAEVPGPFGQRSSHTPSRSEPTETLSELVPVVSEPRGSCPLPWRCLKLISCIKAYFHGDRRWKKVGREETAPGRTEAGTGREIHTGTLERVKQRWASAGGERPAPLCGKGHGCPEASVRAARLPCLRLTWEPSFSVPSCP